MNSGNWTLNWGLKDFWCSRGGKTSISSFTPMHKLWPKPPQWPPIKEQHENHLNGFRLCSQLHRQQLLTIHLWTSPLFAWGMREEYKRRGTLSQRWMTKVAVDIFDYKPLNSNEGSLQSIASIIAWNHKLLLQVWVSHSPALPSHLQQITFCKHWQRAVEPYRVVSIHLPTVDFI